MAENPSGSEWRAAIEWISELEHSNAILRDMVSVLLGQIRDLADRETARTGRVVALRDAARDLAEENSSLRRLQREQMRRQQQ